MWLALVLPRAACSSGCVGEGEIMPCRYFSGMFLAVPAFRRDMTCGQPIFVKHKHERSRRHGSAKSPRCISANDIIRSFSTGLGASSSTNSSSPCRGHAYCTDAAVGNHTETNTELDFFCEE